MLLSLPGLLYFLVFAPRSAFSLFQFVSYSRVSQCGPFNVSFSGGDPPTSLPLTLTVLPFNSTPLAFVIPNSAWDNSTGSGSYVTPLSLPAGVSFLASLEDAAGNSAALLSDVIQVLPSTNTSCITSNTTTPTSVQLLNSAVFQCLPFSVSRNTSYMNHSISARGFIPASLSFGFQWTIFHHDASHGVDTFTFIMNVAQGLQVALLFDDGRGNRQVSDLLLVQGDSKSPSGCLQPSSAGYISDGSQGLSRPAVIAISVTSSVVILITLVLAILFLRRERRKLIEGLDGAIQNRRTTLPSPLLILGPLDSPKTAQAGISEVVPSSPAPVDPVYPLGSSSTSSSAARRSTWSTILAPFTPRTRSLRSTKSRSSVNRSVKSIRTKNSTKGSSSRRLADLDIEGLLEVASQLPAATEAPRGYPAASPHTVTPALTLSAPPSPSPSSFSFGVANPPLPRELSRQHQQPDVPLSPLTSLSQDWFTLEHPSAAPPRDGPSSRIRPLPAPFPKPTVFALSKNS